MYAKKMEMDEELRTKEGEIWDLRNKQDGEQSDELKKVDKQIEVFREFKDQVKEGRKDFLNFVMVMSGRGKPAGVVEEQWSEEELAMLRQQNR